LIQPLTIKNSPEKDRSKDHLVDAEYTG